VLFRNEEGRPCEVSGISTDITERKEADARWSLPYEEIQA